MSCESPPTGNGAEEPTRPARGRRSAIEAYFLSGWLFLIPYLFLYLLYAWRNWPVNSGGDRPIPPLLHVYWAMHVTNIALAIRAFRAWLKIRSTDDAPRTGGDISFKLVPWLLLALVFYIPGVYLEFPSDPWMHLSRITEWAGISDLRSHSVSNKSSYFFAYSLLGRLSVSHQSSSLSVYYSAISLLLCWQYFRLARAVGLSSRAAFLFVLVQALLAGNSVFGFYRYYGLASTMIAEIGAIALIRLGLYAAQGRWPTKILSDGGYSQPPSGPRTLTFLALAGSMGSLLLLILFNHFQELGIAALGIAAVTVWRLLEWKRSAAWWLLGAVVALSALAVFYWPHNPAIDSIYRPEHWINAWYGFDLLSVKSPASGRMVQILGTFGLVNLAAGLLLLRHNHVAGWLTITPVFALWLPFVAIPFAGALEAYGGATNIISFHRMFFGIPAGLAIGVVASALNKARQPKLPPRLFALPRPETAASVSGKNRIFSYFPSAFGCLLVILLALTTTPTTAPFFNRFWHALMIPPQDLSMRSVRSDFYHYAQSPSYRPESIIAATSGISFVLNAQQPSRLANKGRTIMGDHRWPSDDLAFIQTILAPTPTVLAVIPRPTAIYTSSSLAAYFSGHWLPQEVALNFAGTEELKALSALSGLRSFNEAGETDYYGRMAPGQK